jgi:hypothetical protein
MGSLLVFAQFTAQRPLQVFGPTELSLWPGPSRLVNNRLCERMPQETLAGIAGRHALTKGWEGNALTPVVLSFLKQ